MAFSDKAYCLDACYYKGSTVQNTLERHRRTMVAEPLVVAQRGRYTEDGSAEQHLEARTDGKTNTITTVQKDNLVAVPACMRYCRDEEAKRLRKEYEAGTVKHGYHEHSELHPREDGKTNTLTTVQKDNPILIPIRAGCMPSPDGTLKNSQANRVYTIDGKSVNLVGNGGGGGGGGGAKTGLYAIPSKAPTIYEVQDGMITVKGKTYPIRLPDGFYIIRPLTVRECMRLQTVPEWYAFPVSKAQAYKMLGNGWTVEVIMHLISCVLEELSNEL